MKKRSFFALLLSFALLFCFCCCQKEAPQKGGSTLCYWFDGIGFVEGLSQQEYISLLDRFSYDGKSLTEIAPYAFFENAYGNGCSGSCNRFSYGREEVSQKGKTVVSYLSFFSLPQDLLLPYDCSFSDSADSVLSAFGYPGQADFFHQHIQMKTVIDQENETLVLRNLLAQSNETDYMYPYQLIYTERYEGKDGSTVERSLELYFSRAENPTLVAVRLHLSEQNEGFY